MTSSEVSVCIATYRRPQGLKRLLASLVDQQNAPPFEVVVVDNDAEGSGEEVATGYKPRLGLTYVVEPVRGLARVRNRAIAASNSTFLAFIDDDEWASPQWLCELFRVAKEMSADVVIGPIDRIFAEGVSNFIRNCGLFDKRPYADGDTIPWYHARTGNALVRRSAMPRPTAPFSNRFDLIGGEDVHFFRRMIDRGARVVAASRALVFEFRRTNRANLPWLLRRTIRTGGTIVEVDWEADDQMRRIRRTLQAGIDGVGHAVKASSLWRRDPEEAARHFVQACQEIGKVLHQAGIRIEEFRNHSEFDRKVGKNITP
jgi:succinoglycan biosynthesis protein ExoM